MAEMSCVPSSDRIISLTTTDRRKSSRAARAQTYCPPASISTWTCGNCVSTAVDTDASALKLVESDYVGGLVAVVAAWRTQDSAAIGNVSQIAVVFRGTDNDENWNINFNMKQSAPPGYLPGANGELIHDGYHHAYSSMRAGIRSALTDVAGALNFPTAAVGVHVSGHSLGGALATLCALDLAKNPLANGTGAALRQVVTFGSPRVGNRAFVDSFEAAIRMANSSSWRVVHGADAVPPSITREERLPQGSFLYHHVPREVWFNAPDDAHTVCDGSGEDPACSASVPVLAQDASAHAFYMGYKPGL